MHTNGKTALVTGATSGIGKATAVALAHAGFSVVICGRRKERLEALQSQLSAVTRVHILSFDVRNQQETLAAVASLPEDFRQIDVLINNAGNAHGLSSIENGDTADWDAMIDINIKGLLYVSKAVIPGMTERRAGHIIHIGSVAGKDVYPKGNVYCATKHAVDALNQGMRMDLNPYGIRVGAVNPGLVKTEFSLVRFKGDEERAAPVYEGYEPLRPEDIADIILFVVTRPYHVNIADLTVYPTAQASPTLLKRD